MKGIQFDNAAQRKTYVGYVYKAGTEIIKEKVLNELNEKYSKLHIEGKIHIHDLEAYGQTYNCLQMDILQGFPYERLSRFSDFRKITEIFVHYKNIIMKLGNEQSGGIGFPNFDEEIAILFDRLNIEENEENLAVLRDSIESFIDWVNCARERCGQVTYYVSLNLGLATSKIGRFSTRSAIEYFKDSSLDVIKPNIIFKVKKGVNYLPEDKNYDLFCLAVESTCKKMIPTYLLFDSEANKRYDPRKVAIMGCRTKVVANLFGEPRSIGRGNIAYTSINLPRIALEIDQDYPKKSVNEKFELFREKWTETAVLVKEILLDRYYRLCELNVDDFPCNYKFNLWIQDFKTAGYLEDIFKNGTLSVGFIGLSEAVEVLSGEKYYSSDENYARALDIVKYMREVVDGFIKEHNLNFTLLASSGEFISGRFPDIDKNYFNHRVIDKEFYTNSFHVDVDSGLHPIQKIMFEGPFHIYANGGCISYMEFSSAPLNNTEAVKESIEAGINNGINYLAMNFPWDKCRSCGEVGTFDDCPKCGSKDILRIRRVSGYLEELDFFTSGKKAEVAHRRPNACISNRGG
ncbi:MAG: anaerobic ribonucleoside-triphosphate reductase [Methanosarcinaceae archaeon]|nr:anaerobic ribonucleoside-triphosphate reductase [Methanosarcinaceae archaeon]